MDLENLECKQCSSACKDCEFEEGFCVECWDFYESNMINWLDFSCVSECPEGTYEDTELNECPVCNPVCITCTGSEPD